MYDCMYDCMTMMYDCMILHMHGYMTMHVQDVCMRGCVFDCMYDCMTMTVYMYICVYLLRD